MVSARRPSESKKSTTRVPATEIFKKGDDRRPTKNVFVSRNFWLTKVFFQILAGKDVSGRCFNPLRPPKYLSSHRRTMAAEPLAAPLHISVTPRLIVTKLEESIVYRVYNEQTSYGLERNSFRCDMWSAGAEGQESRIGPTLMIMTYLWVRY